jgi:DNA-binding MarR family transcriptional regulator
MKDRSSKQLKKETTCLNYKLRRTARLVTQYYDRALRPAGIRTGQFNLMIPVALRGALSVTELADILGMDRSALARNLKPLERKGWVSVSVGTDRRARIVRLTRNGQQLLRTVYPLWERAQTDLSRTFSRSVLRSLLTGLQAAATAVRAED